MLGRLGNRRRVALACWESPPSLFQGPRPRRQNQFPMIRSAYGVSDADCLISHATFDVSDAFCFLRRNSFDVSDADCPIIYNKSHVVDADCPIIHNTCEVPDPDRPKNTPLIMSVLPNVLSPTTPLSGAYGTHIHPHPHPRRGLRPRLALELVFVLRFLACSGEGFWLGGGIGLGQDEAVGQSFAGCLAPKSSFCARNPKFSGAWFRSTDLMSPTR